MFSQRDLDPAPVVISYSWDGTTLGVTEDLVMVFSTAMDPTLTTVDTGGGAGSAMVPPRSFMEIVILKLPHPAPIRKPWQ